MRRGAFLTVLVCALIGATVGPVAAGRPDAEPVGDQISLLFDTPESFQAGEPFHVRHGWSFDPADVRARQLRFRLQVDGEWQRSAGIVQWPSGLPDEPRSVHTVYNFEGGLEAGPHTLTGYWFAPCQWLVDNDILDEDCGSGRAAWRSTLALVEEHIIEFSD